MTEQRRMLLLSDDDLDRILNWYANSHSTGNQDEDEEDDALAVELRAARLAP